MGHQKDLFRSKSMPAEQDGNRSPVIRPLPGGPNFNGSTPKSEPTFTFASIPTSGDQKIKAPVYTRKTSAQAYRAIVEEGVVGRMQKRVYSVVYNQGPMTANEINQACLQEGEVAPSYHKRLSELERMGVVQRVGVRACKVSGRECEAWDVTDSMPAKPKQKIQRTHTIYAVGRTADEAFRAFAGAIGWIPDESSVKALEKIPNGLTWGLSFHDTVTGEAVVVGGMEVPGGFTLTYMR